MKRDIIEWLHECYLKNNEIIDKLTIQNEQLFEKLQDTCFSSDVLDFHEVDCLEDSHDMMDHEKHEKMQVLDVLEDYSDEIQSLVMVEEELELPLENGYTIFEEVHNSTTLEPTHEEIFSFSREVNNPTPMDTSHYDNFSLIDHLGELVLFPTSYTSKFCSSHPNEVWVKGFFLMVPHEEHGHSISPFDDGIIREPYYLCFSRILFYIMIIHINMGAPMMFT